jgi:hypothetical protein
MKKNLLIGIALFLTVGGAVAQDKTNPASAAPDFKFDVEEYNFGTIKQGETVTYEFSFINTGKEPLIITEAHGSCGCTVPQWPKEPIQRGQKGSIKVVFNSAGKVGSQNRTITITSNAKETTKTLYVKGNVETPAQPAENGN